MNMNVAYCKYCGEECEVEGFEAKCLYCGNELTIEAPAQEAESLTEEDIRNFREDYL